MAQCIALNDDEVGSSLKEFMQMNYTELKNVNKRLCALRDIVKNSVSPSPSNINAVKDIETTYGIGPDDAIPGDKFMAYLPRPRFGEAAHIVRTKNGLQPTRSLEVRTIQERQSMVS